jgi:hypothetical protein
MSNARELPTRRTAIAAAAALAVATLAGLPGLARAEELVLHGPHPSLRQNAVSVQFLMGHGFGDSFSGTGMGLGYGMMLRGPLWLDLQMNVRAASCSVFTNRCGVRGSDTEIMAGLAWRFRTDVPAVPYVRGAVGLLHLFPKGADSAVGVGARGGVGVRYYIFDWFGLGLEMGLSVGHGYFADGYQPSKTYTVGDVGVGVEAQFH